MFYVKNKKNSRFLPVFKIRKQTNRQQKPLLVYRYVKYSSGERSVLISLDYYSKHEFKGKKKISFRSYLFQGIYHLHA